MQNLQMEKLQVLSARHAKLKAIKMLQGGEVLTLGRGGGMGQDKSEGLLMEPCFILDSEYGYNRKHGNTGKTSI